MTERKQQPLEQTASQPVEPMKRQTTEQIARKLIGHVQDQKKYQDGYDHAKRCFEHSFETGYLNSGGSESAMYCEAVAFAIRDGMKMTPEKLKALEQMKTVHEGCFNASFYDGVYDLLIEKMKEHQKG